MPKMDKETGCMVMTNREFALAEGYESEFDMFAEIAKEMDEDCRDTEDRFLDSPQMVLGMFQDYYKNYCDNDESDNDVPVKHVATLFVRCSQSIKKSSQVIIAAFVCKDGRTKIQRLDLAYWAGSRMEPPEEDSYVEIF